MIDVVLEGEGPGGALWMDLTAPTPEELDRVAEERGIPRATLDESLAPLHLPSYERVGGTTFVIARFPDEEARAEADAFPEMTRKLGIFLGDRFLVTVHRRPLGFLHAIKEEIRGSCDPVYLQVVMLDILLAGVETYHAPLEQAEMKIHEFEARMLEESSAPIPWREVLRTKVRVQTFKRLLWHMQNVTQKYVPRASVNQPLADELRDRIAGLSFLAESLEGDLDNLLAVQLSLAANSTNDVMRVLTLFSAVFLPISFLVGVYGMNFRMPETRASHGYALVWIAILVTALGVVAWFYRRGWIGRRSGRTSARAPRERQAT